MILSGATRSGRTVESRTRGARVRGGGSGGQRYGGCASSQALPGNLITRQCHAKATVSVSPVVGIGPCRGAWWFGRNYRRLIALFSADVPSAAAFALPRAFGQDGLSQFKNSLPALRETWLPVEVGHASLAMAPNARKQFGRGYHGEVLDPSDPLAASGP